MNDTKSDSTDIAWKNLWRRRSDVLHKLHVTHRYQRKRQRHFDLLDKFTKTATIVLGVTLLGAALKESSPLVGSLISGLGFLALVFGYTDRKQAHKELAESALHLAAKIEEIPHAKVTEELVSQWEAEFNRHNAKEPPALKTLVILCDHEECVSKGEPDHVKLPVFFKRWTSDWISW